MSELDDMMAHAVRAAGRGAVVVAHPDDESLWCGGLIARYLLVDWTVICCSIPVRDPVRAWKFFNACERLGATARLLPFVEDPRGQLQGLEHLSLSGFEVVVSHGEAGEYGHPHHVQVHHAVRARAAGRMLAIGARPGGAGSLTMQLRADELEIKVGALRAYDHVLPYEGRPMTKWEALIARYATDYPLEVETYDRI